MSHTEHHPANPPAPDAKVEPLPGVTPPPHSPPTEEDADDILASRAAKESGERIPYSRVREELGLK
ncbi:MAG: hypothetical protein ABSG86_05500 [Thermoguttaceae bacterium]